jgi:nucleotide-binding universal stress UspA family protein
VATIVVGIDGSEQSNQALRWAVEEARLRGANIRAVHAWMPPATTLMPGPAPGFDLAAAQPGLQEASTRLVRAMVEEVAGDAEVSVEPVAIEGPAVQVLAEEARDAEMLVVGSRGRGGFTGLLLGSVSQALAHHSPCPVLIYRRET